MVEETVDVNKVDFQEKKIQILKFHNIKSKHSQTLNV